MSTHIPRQIFFSPPIPVFTFRKNNHPLAIRSRQPEAGNSQQTICNVQFETDNPKQTIRNRQSATDNTGIRIESNPNLLYDRHKSNLFPHAGSGFQTRFQKGFQTMKEHAPRTFTWQTEQPLRFDVCGQLISLGGFLHHRRTFAFDALILVTEGTLHLTANHVPHSVSAGQYLLLKAGEEHYGHRESEGRLSYLWVHFSAVPALPSAGNPEQTEADCIQDSAKSQTKANLTPVSGSFTCCFPEFGSIVSSGRVSLLFRQLMDLSFEDPPVPTPMLNCALSLLLMELSREKTQHQKIGSGCLPAVVASVMEWIKANYYQPFSVSLLAETFGYQADYLSSLFRKSTGISITRYTNRLRIRAAKTLLTNYDLTIKEAAYSCGFSDEKYFMKVFKQSEGITPTQYKTAFYSLSLLVK